jgi:hypothetical protein
VQTKGSFLSHQVEVAAAYMALKRACEQLKDHLNKEVNCNKTLTADNNELKVCCNVLPVSKHLLLNCP